MASRRTARRSPNKSTSRDDSPGFRIGHAPTTIGDIVRALFPRGTHTEIHISELEGSDTFARVWVTTGLNAAGERLKRPSWTAPPEHPADVFAFAGLLLDLSGATHHVCGSKRNGWSDRHIEFGPRDQARAKRDGRTRWSITTRKGALAFSIPDSVIDAWGEIWEHQEAPVFQALSRSAQRPKWWSAALFLLIAADEACHGVGYPLGPSPQQKSQFLQLFLSMSFADISRLSAPGVADAPETIATISPELLCVLPKARTPQVGTTLRSLTHHLALLPARGLARAFWYKPNDAAIINSRSAPLNILAIPYPYRIQPRAFVATYPDDHEIQKWGWFDLNPH